MKIFLLILLICNGVLAQDLTTYAKKERWAQVHDFALKENNNIIAKFAKSQMFLASNNYSPNDLESFLSRNQDWPQINGLTSKYEAMIANCNCNYKKPNFTSNNIEKTNKLCFINHKIDDVEKTSLKKIWVFADFSNEESKKFLSLYGKYINQSDHFAKAENLLWGRNIDAAKKIYPYLNASQQAQINSVIASISQSHNASILFKKLPDGLKHNSLVMFYYLKYQIELDSMFDMAPYLLKAPTDTTHSSEWWKLFSRSARELLAKKEYAKAYSVVSKFHSEKTTDIAEKEWMSGWISLNFLNKKELAGKHFTALYNAVKTPISLSRAKYWLAQSQNNQEAKQQWLTRAAQHPETFYGQLAAAKLGRKSLPPDTHPVITNEDRRRLAKSESAQIAIFLLKANLQTLSKPYIKHAINSAHSAGEVDLFLRHIKNSAPIGLLVESSKIASHRHVFLRDFAFPRPYKAKNNAIPEELLYAIMRQESMMDHKAVSTANAYGLMQLIEPTARETCKKLKMTFQKRKLMSDPHYNMHLGGHHLRHVIDKFDGSYIMAIAAYNAGPMPVNKWINNNGDPRCFKNIDDVVNWIELIPYYETRNYVHRVMENIHIYRTIADPKSPLLILYDLKGVKNGAK